MISATEQIQVLYEISLSIGEGNSLKSAAKKALSVYLRKLNCSAGVVFQRNQQADICWFKKISTIPKRIEKNRFFREIIEEIPTTAENLQPYLEENNFPKTKYIEDYGYAYLMKLKGFGILVLIKKGQPLPDGFLYTLRPLNQKLADSLIAFKDRENLHLQSQALESNNNAIIITDPHGIIEWVNEAWCSLNEYKKEEVIGQKPSIIKSGQHGNPFYKEMWNTILSGKTWNGTLINRKKGGESYYFEYSINPVFNGQGEIINFIGTGQDISLRKKALDELKESKKRFEDMANLLPQPIWETDNNGWFTYTNKSGHQVMGYTEEDIKNGVLFTELIAPAYREKIIDRFQDMVRGAEGSRQGNEYLCQRKDGTTFPALIFTTPIFYDNVFRGVRGITLDISEMKKTQEELTIAKEKAENAEKAQFNFLSTMSHEIRTPLNAVIGLTNILLMQQPLKRQKENLDTLKFSSQNLLSIINDILDFNKLYSNNVYLEKEDFNLNAILKGVHFAMSSLANEKEIYLEYSVAEDIPEVLVGDSTRLQQILNNLVSNAIKFTRKGGVKIKVTTQKKTKKQVLLHFEVRDTGIGIPADKQKTIFEEFQQTSASITREFGGTGLGLPIVKRLLNLMGSDIKLSSKLGEGSVFEFQINFLIGRKKVEKEPENVTIDKSLKDKNILLVEDNTINQMVAHRFLNEWKCKTDIAGNGKEALDKLKLNQYDLILMDLHMPVMDGYTTTEKIRKLEQEGKSSIPIIALSASALGEIETKARKFGMDGFVTKPFQPDVLFNTMRKHLT